MSKHGVSAKSRRRGQAIFESGIFYCVKKSKDFRILVGDALENSHWLRQYEAKFDNNYASGNIFSHLFSSYELGGEGKGRRGSTLILQTCNPEMDLEISCRRVQIVDTATIHAFVIQ